jgi:hypothetical protein
MEILQRGWSSKLRVLFQNVRSELTISSPYISDGGADFLIKALPQEFKDKGVLRFVTDLSPQNIYQGSTNPFAFESFFENINLVRIFHLPRLHAKVYVQDNNEAIITSGNLTAGGLFNNFEYGTFINDKSIIPYIKNDLTDYGNLGALVNRKDILHYCNLTEKIKEIDKRKEYSTNKDIELEFESAVNKADDELIRLKLTDGKIHPIFEKTILYLLKKYNALSQNDTNRLIKDIHPDLCDDNVNRVINGVIFGRKWKHAARTAMQVLKKKGLVKLVNDKWTIVN